MTAPNRLQIKLYTRKGRISTDTLISQFHTWIQDDVLEEIAIDVADYSHVPDGPGILLITHEADYAFDDVGGGGLRYVRKKEVPVTLKEAILQGYERVLKAVNRLEEETADSPEEVQFDLSRLEITLLDRRLYPNTTETAESVQGALGDLFNTIFGDTPLTFARPSRDTRYPFALKISAFHSLDIAGLLETVRSLSVTVTPL